MPDFDTRRPQEPDQPNRLHMFVVASKQHISAVGRWTGRIMIRHWRLGLSVSYLAVLVVLTAQAVRTYSEQEDGKLDWAVETPAEQLGQEIELPPTPAYSLYNDMDSSAYYCEPEDAGYAPSVCFGVGTKTSDAMKLASITEDIVTESDYGDSRVHRLKVIHGSNDHGYEIFATIYCFKRKIGKSVAVSALGSALKKARFLGKTDNCYLTIYKGDVELLLIPPD
jgi:hypothetical protein